MDVAWLISLLTVYCLPLKEVGGQFGIYYDTQLGANKYYKSLQCPSSRQYYPVGTWNQRASLYTRRTDTDCCYLVGTRNRCCETVTFNLALSQFINICKCDPMVTTCIIPTATRATTAATTTLPPPTLPPTPFCPEITSRVLHSITVADQCGAFPGVFAVVRNNPGSATGPTAICNAVLAQAVVNGFSKLTLVTSQFCRKIADAGQGFIGLNIQVTPTFQIPYTKFKKINGRGGVAFFHPDDNTVQLLTSSCKRVACGLRLPEMTAKIDYDNCKVLSYGSYQASTLKQGGLRIINVRIEPMGCRGVSIMSATNTMCFTTKDQVPVMCSGDYGAPVFCRSSRTGENIVVGVVAGTNLCGAVTSFGVVRYPTF